MGAQSMNAEAVEPQETMLPWSPSEMDWDRDTDEAIVLDRHTCFLTNTVFDECPK